VVHVEEPRAVVNAVHGGGKPAPDELVEQRVAPIAAIGDAGEGGVLPLHTQTRVPHDQDEEPGLALGEAVIDDSLMAFGGGHQSNISSASPP